MISSVPPLDKIQIINCANQGLGGITLAYMQSLEELYCDLKGTKISERHTILRTLTNNQDKTALIIFKPNNIK
jgi:hypothetical protein